MFRFARWESWWRRSAAMGVLAAGLSMVTPAMAATSQPTELVRGVTTQIVALADAGVPAAERQRRGEALLAENVAVDRLARAVLGRHWRSASEAQRARFVELLPGYLRATYGGRLGEAAGYRLELGTPRPSSGGDVVVPAQARRGNGAPVSIDWRLTQAADGWRILDVVVEGVSLALAWRNEFDAVIGRQGIDGLLDQMARRAETREVAADS